MPNPQTPEQERDTVRRDKLVKNIRGQAFASIIAIAKEMSKYPPMTQKTYYALVDIQIDLGEIATKIRRIRREME